MKASEWIQMIWDTIPDANHIHLRHGVLKVDRIDESNIFELPDVCLHIQRDVPWSAERPVETERLLVEANQMGLRTFGVDKQALHTALDFTDFLGYELADGTLSPRLEAGMDVRYCVFRK